jgi:hypothetical protein
MKTVTVIGIVILAVVLTSAVWYTVIFNAPKSTPIARPTTIPTATLTPTPIVSLAPATVTANVVASAVSVAPLVSAGQVLVINGTVTNNSPNTAYNVGLHATASGSYEFPYASTLPAINLTVPIASGEYGQNYVNANTPTTYVLSTLAPYQSVFVSITITPWASSQEPVLSNVNVVLVWANTPT